MNDIVTDRPRRHLWLEHMRDGLFVGGITVDGPFITNGKWYVLIRKPGESWTDAYKRGGRVIEYQTFLLNIVKGERARFRRIYKRQAPKMCSCGAEATHSGRSVCQPHYHDQRKYDRWLERTSTLNTPRRSDG